MQLGNDNALGTVDNEGTVFGHQGHFAHVDFLFLDILDRAVLGRGFLVVDHQSHQHAQRRGIGQATDLALLDVENRIADAIADVLELDVTAEADNRKNRFEGALQTGAFLVPFGI